MSAGAARFRKQVFQVQVFQQVFRFRRVWKCPDSPDAAVRFPNLPVRFRRWVPKGSHVLGKVPEFSSVSAASSFTTRNMTTARSECGCECCMVLEVSGSLGDAAALTCFWRVPLPSKVDNH